MKAIPEEELQQKEAYSDLTGEDGFTHIAGRDYTFMQEIAQVNITKAFKEAATNVLAIHGEADIAAIDSEWAEYTAHLVNNYYPGKGSWKLLPETEHSFAKVGTMEEYMKERADGRIDQEYLKANFNEGLVQMIAEWINGLNRS